VKLYRILVHTSMQVVGDALPQIPSAQTLNNGDG